MSYAMLLSKTRTARKPHRCIWCGEPINAGEKYIDHRYVGDDGPAMDRYHPECDDAVSRSGDDVAEGFAAYEQLRGLTMENSIDEKDRRYRKEKTKP